MQDDPRNSPEARALDDVIEHMEIAMLVSVAPDGVTLVSRPLATLQADPQGDLWFFISKDSGKVDDIELHPQVNLSYADPAQHLYVSVVGEATLVGDRERIRALWTDRVKPYFPQGVDDPALCLLRVRVRSAEYWQQPGELMRQRVRGIRPP